MLIAIHRDSFQHMISGSDEVLDSDADLVPVSSGSIASRALCRIQAIRGRGSSYVDPEAGSSSPEPSPARPNSFNSTWAVGAGLDLKNNFSASELSRSDQSPDVSAPQRILLERAVTARATMKAWCDLRGLAPMQFVTMPLPEPLQELQVRAHRSVSIIALRSSEESWHSQDCWQCGLLQVRLMESQVDAMRPKMQECKAALEERADAVVQQEKSTLAIVESTTETDPTKHPAEAGRSCAADVADAPDWSSSGGEFFPLSPVTCRHVVSP